MQNRILRAAESAAGLPPRTLGQPREIRHAVATYVYHLGVRPGRYPDERLTQLLRHQQANTKMKSYVLTGIAGQAMARIEANPAFQRMNWDKLQLGWLLRM